MKRREDQRKKPIVIYLTDEEYTAVMMQFSASTCQYMAEYGRKRLLDKPIIGKYRNVAADEFLVAATAIKSEMERCGCLLEAALSGDSLTGETVLNQLSGLDARIAGIGNTLHAMHEKLRKL